MKIREQTRKLDAGCSKHCFEVVDGSKHCFEVVDRADVQIELTWFEEILE
ncbi:N-ethylammeline chlorohydrolase [Streptococcus pneumoniae]|nr:N-ethylammeline chlorohydrolase [Streptococcus pneumoniae]